MTDLTSLTIAQAREKLAAREITSLELTDAYLSAIERANKSLNAYIVVNSDKARQMASNSDENLSAGNAGPRRRCSRTEIWSASRPS